MLVCWLEFQFPVVHAPLNHSPKQKSKAAKTELDIMLWINGERADVVYDPLNLEP